MPLQLGLGDRSLAETSAAVTRSKFVTDNSEIALREASMEGQLLKFLSSSLVVFGMASILLPAALAAEEEPEEHFHRNEASLVLGGTYESEEKKSFFTIGGDYEYRLNPRIGIGGTLEHLTDLDAWLLIIPVTFHLHEGLAVYAGPGWELEPRRVGGGESHAEEEGKREAIPGTRWHPVWLRARIPLRGHTHGGVRLRQPRGGS